MYVGYVVFERPPSLARRVAPQLKMSCFRARSALKQRAGSYLARGEASKTDNWKDYTTGAFSLTFKARSAAESKEKRWIDWRDVVPTINSFLRFFPGPKGRRKNQEPILRSI